MEVSPVSVIQYFDGQKQNLIPLFQRPYQWIEKNWNAFWEDLIIQYTNERSNASESHFMGAIVSIPATSVPVGVNKYLIIDGQQRLTTIAILLCVLRDHFKFIKSDNYAGRIHNLYLTNQYQEINDTLKFVPTQTLNDRDIYKSIVIDHKKPSDTTHLMVKCYDYFHAKINSKIDDESYIDPEKILLTLEKKFQVVMINLGKEDDPHLIFESLNFKGAPLTQADLVRNYILMQFTHSISPGGEQERIYKEYWMPLGDGLIVTDENGNNRDYLTDFLRHYAMRHGDNVLKTNVYNSIKKEIIHRKNSGVENVIADIKKHGEYYEKILCLRNSYPNIEKRLNNIKQLDTTVPYPLLLKILSLHEKTRISLCDVEKCLATIESFIVRRSVCNLPANSLGKIFLSITKEIDKEHNIAYWLHKKLSTGTGNSKFPTNDEFTIALISNNSLYSSKITKHLLDQIEISHRHKESVSLKEATIEHIMPQTLSDDWRTYLGEDEEKSKALCDNIGNLTLTAYNSEMSNNLFEYKRDNYYKSSNYQITKKLASYLKWNYLEIESRARELACIAVSIWEPPSSAEN